MLVENEDISYKSMPKTLEDKDVVQFGATNRKCVEFHSLLITFLRCECWPSNLAHAYGPTREFKQVSMATAFHKVA